MSSDSVSTTPATAHAIDSAQALVRAGRMAEAEQAFRGVLRANPEQVPALRFLAGAALQRGAAGEAIDLLNRAAQVDRNDTGTLLELGIAYRGADRMDAARSVLERALELGDGRDTTIRLLLANVLELDQRPELALLHYFRAILGAQRAGLWFDDNTTAPGLRELVNHAMRYVGDGRRILFASALQACPEHPANASDRVDRALAIYLRDRQELPADPRQCPTLLYIPDLGTSPLPALAQPAWLTTLLAKVATIAVEVDTCLRAAARTPAATASSLTLTSAADVQAGNAATMAPTERRADVYRGGTVPDATRRRAPQLLDILAAAPLMRIPRYAPNATLIALPPAARTTAEYSRSNSGCSVVVGLPDSAEIEITIGTDKHRLKAGGAVMVDGSYGIGYANPGTAEARVLVFDVWHPELSTLEEHALTALLAAIVDFDTRLQELA